MRRNLSLTALIKIASWLAGLHAAGSVTISYIDNPVSGSVISIPSFAANGIDPPPFRAVYVTVVPSPSSIVAFSDGHVTVTGPGRLPFGLVASANGPGGITYALMMTVTDTAFR